MATHSSIAWSILRASVVLPGASSGLQKKLFRTRQRPCLDDTAKAIRRETDKPSLPSRLGLAPRGREDPPLHAPTHHCPTRRMSGEDPHSPRGAQSSAGPHEVGWEGRQQVEFKTKKKPNASAASPLQAGPEEAQGLRWERFAGLRGKVLCMPGGSGTSSCASTPEPSTRKPADVDGVRQGAPRSRQGVTLAGGTSPD